MPEWYTPTRKRFMLRTVWTTIRSVTDRAIKIRNYHNKDVWLPLSQIQHDEDELHVGDEVAIRVPMWLFHDRQLSSRAP